MREGEGDQGVQNLKMLEGLICYDAYPTASKHLEVTSTSIAQSAKLLKAAVGNGRVYV